MAKQYIIEDQEYSLNTLQQKAEECLAKEGLSDFLREVWLFIQEWLDDSPEVLLHTSGSTGKPKAMMMPKTYMRQSAQMTLDFFSLQPGAVALCCLPASYIAGKMMIVRALEGGLNLHFSAPKGNPLKKVDRVLDFVALVPLQLENILRDEIADFAKVKHLLVGGAVLSKNVEQQLQKLDVAVWHSYGMTETVSHIALRKVNGAEKSAFYAPMPGVTITVDENQRLEIDAPALTPHKIKTNDLVEINQEGHFRFLGRYDNVINTGAVKVSPELVEKKIAHLIPARFMISSEADERLGRRLVLVIEGEESAFNLTKLWRAIKAVLPRYEQPKALIFLPQFEETTSGKLKRLKF